MSPLGARALAIATLALFAGCDRSTSPLAEPLKLELVHAPGGALDGLAPVLAVELGRALGRPVAIVPGRPGGFVPTNPRSTLLLASSDVLVVTPSFESRAIGPPANFCALALVAQTPHVLAVAEDSNFDTVASVVEAARRDPGSVSYGTLENGTATDALGQRFAARLALDLAHVRYRTSGAALRDVLGGHLEMMFGTLAATLPAARAGTLRVLAVGSRERVSELPDVPTFAEAGLPDLASTSWYGLFAPCDLPGDAVASLYAAARDVVAGPALASALGIAPLAGAAPLFGADFHDFVEASAAYWTDAVAELRAAAPNLPH